MGELPDGGGEDRDAGASIDAGTSTDSGITLDAGVTRDAGTPDAGPPGPPFPIEGFGAGTLAAGNPAAPPSSSRT